MTLGLSPTGASPAPPPASFANADREGNLYGVFQEACAQMDPGDRVTLSSEDLGTVEIRKGELTGLERMGRVLADAASRGPAQLASLVAADPSFAFRQLARLLHNVVAEGVPAPIRQAADKGFYPLVRAASMAFDAAQAHETVRNPEASRTDRAVDVAHVATDVVGLVGLGLMMTPAGFPIIGAHLAAAAVLGDVGAYGYHLVNHLSELQAAARPEAQAA